MKTKKYSIYANRRVNRVKRSVERFEIKSEYRPMLHAIGSDVFIATSFLADYKASAQYYFTTETMEYLMFVQFKPNNLVELLFTKANVAKRTDRERGSAIDMAVTSLMDTSFMFQFDGLFGEPMLLEAQLRNLFYIGLRDVALDEFLNIQYAFNGSDMIHVQTVAPSANFVSYNVDIVNALDNVKKQPSMDKTLITKLFNFRGEDRNRLTAVATYSKSPAFKPNSFAHLLSARKGDFIAMRPDERYGAHGYHKKSVMFWLDVFYCYIEKRVPHLLYNHQSNYVDTIQWVEELLKELSDASMLHVVMYNIPGWETISAWETSHKLALEDVRAYIEETFGAEPNAEMKQLLEHFQYTGLVTFAPVQINSNEMEGEHIE